MARVQFLLVPIIALSAACGENELDRRLRYDNEVSWTLSRHANVRYADLAHKSPDQTCLKDGKTTIRGIATDEDINEIASVAMAKLPEETIQTIGVTPTLAYARTGINCVALAGYGHYVFFEPDNGAGKRRWRFTLLHTWIS